MSVYRPSESERESFGITVATSKFWGAILGSALLATQICMVVYGSSIFLGTPRDKRKGRTRFIVISWIILVTSGIDTMIDIWYHSRILLTGGPTGISYLKAIPTQWEINEKTKLRPGDTMLCIAIAVGDALMLWRCFVLWWDKKWVVIPPMAAFIGSIVSYIALLVPDESLVRVDSFTIAAVCLSVVMNLMITGVVLWKLGQTWLHVSRAFPDRKSPKLYGTVAAAIIESALPLAIFGIFSMITVAVDRFHLPENIAERARVKVLRDISGWLYYGFCALSPQMIIFRVTTGKSWKNIAETHGGVTVISQPIQFGVHGIETKSSTDGV